MMDAIANAKQFGARAVAVDIALIEAMIAERRDLMNEVKRLKRILADKESE